MDRVPVEERRRFVETSSDSRSLVQVVAGQPASDGAGVRLTRLLGQPALEQLDPFLLFDEIRSKQASDYLAGFPNHPHRGFETVTYMLAGRMRHEDNQGNSGLLRAGSAQWMTAGRGVVHSEMPEQEDGLLWGFQLWVNLPASEKRVAPRYRDIEPSDIPEVVRGRARVRVVAGVFGEAEGPITGVATEPVFLDIRLPRAEPLDAELPPGHASFAFVYRGSVRIGAERDARTLAAGELGVLGPGRHVRLEGDRDETGLLLVAGRPLREPVARHGPFVMNTREELIEAFEDYATGRL